MRASMTCCRAKQSVSSRFSFTCMARFFAGLFFDAFFMRKRVLKQLQPI